MNAKSFLNALGQVDEKYVLESIEYKANGKRNTRAKWAAMAACICLIAGVIMLYPHTGNKPSDSQPEYMVLSDKSTAKVSYGYDEKVVNMQEWKLVYLTEDQMFSDKKVYIFRGKVKELTNLTIDFNGSKEVRCVASIEIEKVYKGDIIRGKEIRVLLPCPISEGPVTTEDTSIISQIKCGMEGIFMPRVYGTDSYWEENGAVLFMTDLAPCGFGDGMRWAFLDTEHGLVFERNSYPGASSARTLDEIEKYVIGKLN